MPPRSNNNHRKDWVRWSDERLLDLRICDLGVRLKGTWLEEPVEQLYEELAAKDIRVRPHVWLSSEWFSPDGVPGIGVPFYLAHPRLMKLERRQMLEVEGGTKRGCMKLLRHEAGHAVQHAFRLHRKRKAQQVFGKSSEPYPDFYRSNPASKRYVQNLDLWYAQSHPDEDFAETFAVWLQPSSQWRKRYRGWPALKKLECVDQLMGDIAGRKPPVTCRERVEPVRTLRQTLRSYYERKREHYLTPAPKAPDAELRCLFDAAPGRGEPATRFLRRHRREVIEHVKPWVGDYEFALRAMYDEALERCKALGLRAPSRRAGLARDFAIMITARTMRYVYRAREWHPV